MFYLVFKKYFHYRISKKQLTTRELCGAFFGNSSQYKIHFQLLLNSLQYPVINN